MNHIDTLEHIEIEEEVPSIIFCRFFLKPNNFVENIISIVTYLPTVVIVVNVVNFQLSKLRNGKI